MANGIFNLDSGVSASHRGFRGPTLSPDVCPGVYALYLFGAELPSGFPSTDSRPQSLSDYSNFRQYLTEIGATTLNPSSVIVDGTNYFVAPFSVDDVAAENGEITFIAVGKWTTDLCGVVGNYNGTAQDGTGILIGGGGQYQMVANAEGGAAVVAAIPVDAAFNDWEMLAMTADVTSVIAYKYNTTGVATPVVTATGYIPAGANLVRIGRSTSGTYTGAQELGLIFVSKITMSQVQLAAFYAEVQAWFAGLDTPVTV